MTDFRSLCAELLDEVTARPLILDRGLIDRARAALAQPAPPADAEVTELVAWLSEKAVQAADADQPKAAGMLTWAAQAIGEQSDLLERQQSVPVGEGKLLYEFAVYDAETDEPQAGGAAPTLEEAEREGRHYFAMYSEDGPMRLELRRVEMLPAHALPLPTHTSENVLDG